jgi:hypothetical protein
MKKLFKFIGLSVVTICFSATVFGQGVSATANASAVIITPIAITKTTDMSFGNLAVGASGGSIILSTASGRTATGDVSYQAAPAATAAAFDVTGSAGLSYAITLPTTATITSGANSMTINTFVSNPTSPSTLVAGSNTLLVGATLVVGASQPTGTYTGTFDVTVGYN